MRKVIGYSIIVDIETVVMKKFWKIIIAAVLCISSVMSAIPAYADENSDDDRNCVADDELKEIMESSVRLRMSCFSENGTDFPSEFISDAGNSYSDWYAVTLGRIGIRGDYGSYLALLRDYVERRYRTAEKLSAYAATEWHRISLTVLALGGDPTCFGTDADGNSIDLIADGTYNRSETASLGAQGVNAYIWSLITLDSLGYEVPAESGDTRESMISAVLGSQLGDGGFSLDGKKSDIDITAMALQALSPYRENETVTAAAERAVLYLSEEQTPSGDFISWGKRSLESTAQVAVALCTLGIDPETDSRFIKDGNNIISSMMNYRSDDGGFLRTYDTVPDKKESSDYVATEQALRALCAFYRYRNGLRSFYDFRSETEAQTGGMLYGIFEGDIFSASSGFGEKEYSEYLALPESPDGSYYTEVTRLYMKFLEAGSPEKYQDISEGLAEKKRTVDRIYEEIENLSNEISEKIYPVSELSADDREMILSLTERAEKLSEYDRSRISGIDDLYLARDTVASENVRPVYIFAALCILFIAAALICLVYKKHKSTHTENKN